MTVMEEHHLTELLQAVQNGTCDVGEALDRLRKLPAEALSDAVIDHHRQLRTGIPEVIYGESKSAEQIIEIASALLARGATLLATRISFEKAQQIQSSLPRLHYAAVARLLVANPKPVDRKRYHGTALVLCAGTSDIPVAEEARQTLLAFGHPVDHLFDVGVAGLHRLLANHSLLVKASVIIVVAGMEGALPSVVGGLVQAPVIAVPTSIGYGASFGGMAALLGMLNSCAPGVAVVNIDNGFGAACMAEAINRRRNDI